MGLDSIAQNLVFVTGFSYIFVGQYLLRRASWAASRPEFFLGLAFVLNGVSYGFSELPFVADLESIVDEFSFAGRIAAGASALAIAVFVLRVFRAEVGWARALIGVTGALIAGGLLVSAVEGDWEGMSPLTYKGFWLDWLGGLSPYVWLSIESFRRYTRGRRGLRLGIGETLVCNRFLLIALYGAFATITYFLFVPMYIQYEQNGDFSPALDLSLGLIELISLAALWTSFAAPSAYRRWIGGESAEAH